MTRIIRYCTGVGCILLYAGLAACHENPHNTFGGPSDHPKDTAIAKHDTSSIGRRTDR